MSVEILGINVIPIRTLTTHEIIRRCIKKAISINLLIGVGSFCE